MAADAFAPAVLERDNHQCQWCAMRGAEAHHRQFRSRRGRHEPDNRVTLCGPGGAGGCHGRAHVSEQAEAQRLGYVVPSWQDPGDRAVWSEPRGTWLFLEPDGTVIMLGGRKGEVPLGR